MPVYPSNAANASVVSPAVITSNAATKDLATNIQPNYQAILNGINEQALKIKATVDAQAAAEQAKKEKETADKLEQDKLAAQRAGATPTTPQPVDKTITLPDGNQYVITPQGEIVSGTRSGSYQPGTNISSYADSAKLNALLQGKSEQEAGLAQNQADLERKNKEYDDEANRVKTTLDNYVNGTIPLTPAQQAQVDGLKQQFQALIEQQKLTNIGAQGSASVRGFQRGAAEYDANFQNKTIGSIVNAGLQKVADLNTKMATAVADLTEAFQTKNYEKIKGAWDVYNDASKQRRDALQKTIDETNKQIKEAKDAAAKVQEEELKSQQELQKDIDKISLEAAKNGASQMVLDSINSASTVGEAIQAAGDSLTSGAGIVGEYLFYKRQALAAGQVPVDFDTYQTIDANRKAKAAGNVSGAPAGFVAAMEAGATGSELLNTLTPVDKATVQALLDYTKNPANLSLRKGAGESQSEREKFLGMAHLIDPSYDETQYAARSAVKKDFTSGKSAQNIRSLNTAVGHLNSLSEAADNLDNASVGLWNKVKNVGLSAVGDPRVVAFNTAATAVEGELASVFKGMGATDQEIKVWRDNLSSSQSPEQLHAAIDTAIELMGSRMQALSSQYEIGLGKPKDFKILNDKSRDILTKLGADVEALDPVADTGGGVGGSLIKSEQDAKAAINTYVQQNPNDTDMIVRLYEIPGTTDADIYEYLKSKGKIK